MSEEILYKTRSEVTNYLSDSYMLNIITDVIDNNIELLREYKQLQQENQQLKGKLKMTEHNKEQSELQCRRYRNKRKTLNHRIKRREQQRDRYKSLLDEIREQLKLERKLALSLNKPYTVSVIDKLLDKVKE